MRGQATTELSAGRADLRDELVRNKALADDTFRAQDAEMRQLQETMTEVQA